MKSIEILVVKHMYKVLIMGLILFQSFVVSGQSNDFVIEVVAGTVEVGDVNATSEITLSVENSNSTYTYSIFDKESYLGSTVIEYAENISAKSHTFSDLKAGNYYVCVVDEQNNSRCKTAIIEEE